MGIIKDVQQTGNPTRDESGFERRLAKATEELGELAEAILSVTSAANSKNKDHMDIVEEAVDVAIMGLDIALTKPDGSVQTDSQWTDSQWRDVVSLVFATKLTKWRGQIETDTTLMPRKPVHEDLAAEIRRRHLASKIDNTGATGNIEMRTNGDQPFPEPTEGCGKIIGHGQKCGHGILCMNCQKSIVEGRLYQSDTEARCATRERTDAAVKKGDGEITTADPTIEPMNDEEQFVWDQCTVLQMDDSAKAIWDEMHPGWREEQDAQLKEFRQRKIAELRRTRPTKLTADEQFDAEIDAGLHK